MNILRYSVIRLSSAIVLLTLANCQYSQAQYRLPAGSAEQVGMDLAQFEHVDPLVEQAIAAGKLPGCVVLIGRHGHIAFQKAYGQRQVEPEPIAMTTDTVFDLASLTKPIATATSVMVLVERGKIRLRDPISKYIPEFGVNGKKNITVEQLLTHRGGLVPDNALADYQDGPKLAWERIFALTPKVEPGTKFMYTDVGYLVLAELVKRITDQNIDEFSHENIFAPLGMADTGYTPDERLQQRAAPTEKIDGKWRKGKVHDPRAYLLDGIAGHAGLFSTAGDLAVYAQMMLSQGSYAGKQILGKNTVGEMTRARTIDNNIAGGNNRGLGWDMRSVYSRNRGEFFTPRAFGHGGFTGTVIWMDPGLDMFIVFLANRLHPDGQGEVNDLAGRIGTIAAGAIRDPASTPSGRNSVSQDSNVLTGLDVLVRDQFRPLANKRVGLITNHTGVDTQGRRIISLLHEAPNVNLVALFSPEHGIAGKLDISTINDDQDSETGLKIYSLYGESRQPTAEQLANVDTIVFDIQDIGARFYTYISTMKLAMQAAAAQGIEFVVLDRPNPIGGIAVEGPMLDVGSESFVGTHPMPVRHGMTIGELANLMRDELNMQFDLTVVPVENWNRAQFWDNTGLTWVNPSPNMRCLTQAVLYPGVGLIETTNVSVGRGTDTPFEIFGAPWIDGRELAARLNAAVLQGVRFIPIEFTPDTSKHANKLCSGVNIHIVNRDQLHSVRIGLEIACALRELYPDEWETDRFNRLLINQEVFDAVVAGKSRAELEAMYQPMLNEFRPIRAKYLLYQ